MIGKGKIKRWFDEHEKEIIFNVLGFGYTLLVCGAGCLITNKMCAHNIDKSFRWLHDESYIKLFNPSTGLEITLEELCELLVQKQK